MTGGQSLEIQAPGSAQKFSVCIPAGVQPGQSFLANLPNSLPTVAVVAQQPPLPIVHHIHVSAVLSEVTNRGVFALYNQGRWIKIFAFLDCAFIVISAFREREKFFLLYAHAQN
jgi:hypothetical protein